MSAAKEEFVLFEEYPPVTVGTIEGSRMLDGNRVTAFGRAVTAYVQAHPGVQLLLDFSGVSYLSSAALTELIQINDAVVAGGGTIRLYGISSEIMKVFTITKFDKMFTIYNDAELDRAIDRYKRSIEMTAAEEAWENRRG